MSYLFRGILCGYLCPHCREAISETVVQLYELAPNAAVEDLVAAPAKDTLAQLADEDFEARRGRLLGEARTDGEGKFVVELSEKNYRGGPVEVVVIADSVPQLKDGAPDAEQLRFTVTAVDPDWQQAEKGKVFDWDYCIPQRFWCAVRTHFGAWTICGRVLDCDAKVGVAGLTVTAFDTDWFQHDNLGSAVTDGSGHFRIDYLIQDFKKTPLSPFINLEWVGGPDLFFKVESGGDVVLEEAPSRGREPDRENSGQCACVELCVEGEGPPVDDPLFTHIGDFHIYADIDAGSKLTNKAFFGHGGPDFAFFGGMKLKGFCPKTEAGTGNPMRYRFLYEHPANPAVQVPITGGAVVPVVVGARLIQWKVTANVFEWAFQSIVVAGAGATVDPTPQPGGPGPWGAPPAHIIEPDGDGWVEVDPDGLDDGFYGPLVRFNSAKAVPGGAAPGDGAGNAVADPKNGAVIAITYEAGPVGGGATFSNSVDVKVNNWQEVRQLDLVQFGGPGGNPCSPLTTDLDVLYTVDHEHLDSWALSINSASGSAPGGVIPPVPAGATARGHAATHSEAIGGWASCSYQVNLSSRRALTDGENDDNANNTQVTFCK